MWTALQEWWAQNVVADDPAPEYTYLDRLDGLQRGRNADHGLTERKQR